MNELQAPTATKLILKGTRRNIFTLWKPIPFERALNFEPLTLSNLKAISNLLMTIGSTSVREPNASTVAFSVSIASADIDKMAEVVAIAAERFPGIKRRQLKNQLMKNTTAEELSNLYQIVVDMMDLPNFLKSIVLVRGVSILGPRETAPESKP
ncbi:hypothetical protein ACX0G7_09620 [Flavitalea antarctica]